MAQTGKKSYELSEAEQRDLITLLQQGKPLPEKYRFILFEDKREVELVWNGKNRDVCTTVLPFQTLEHVDEPRAETRAQGDLFDSRGRQMHGWTNKLIWGDNKLILSSLKAGALRQQIEDAGGLKLIYIDPPFDVGADFSMDIEIGGETFHKEANILEQIAYRDTWGRGADCGGPVCSDRFFGFLSGIIARRNRGGGNVKISFIDFQGLWEGRETALSFFALSTDRHFHGRLRCALCRPC